MSATIATVANLKGGVGKSTTTLMLADGLAYYYGAEVLVVDMDPQANSSQMLLTDRGLQMAFKQGKGVHHLLNQFMENEPPNIANLDPAKRCDAGRIAPRGRKRQTRRLDFDLACAYPIAPDRNGAGRKDLFQGHGAKPFGRLPCRAYGKGA